MARELEFADPPAVVTEHRTTTVEHGRFLSARCSCGWRGAARRARSRAGRARTT
ncbi:hypothetical protein ACWD6I_01290 [Streptomyces sp. NPDC002454]